MEKVPSDIFAIYFSNFSAHQIEYGGVVYPTVEHAFHCARYSQPEIRAEIMRARSPEVAWEISQKHKAVQNPDFKEKKRDIMKELIRAKVAQHGIVKKVLLDTGDTPIIKHVFTFPPGNGFWDDGASGEGRNEMGKILMEIREEFRNI